MKTLQQIAQPTLDYQATMLSKRDYKDKDDNKNPVAFKMAVFAWKEENKAMRARKER
jgi:hypothetical protein